MIDGQLIKRLTSFIFQAYKLIILPHQNCRSLGG